jgi:oxygen-independent coproporphyrinogen-3 oxidase
MVTELKLQRSYLGGVPLETIYLGGGTPSILAKGELQFLFDTIRTQFLVESGAEVTLEVNPDDITLEKLDVFKSLGVNRLSIGIQSFSDSVLKFFNRAHVADEAAAAFYNARKAGFGNISVDLIYGVPNQSTEQWAESVDQLLALDPEHISAYALTIEENTVFGRWNKRGALRPQEEGLVVDQFEMLMDRLDAAGYAHYEISNFAKPGFLSRHNSNYWRQKWYLGVGPSAHSFNGVSRQFNVRNNARYIKSLSQGVVPSELEVLSWQDKVNEYIMTSLRTSWGCDLSYLQSQLGFSFASEQLDYLEQLALDGYVDYSKTKVTLLRKGKMIADKIASDLFVIDDAKMANFRP